MTDPCPVEESQPRDRRPGGRPRKYAEPSQPVTVTLPQSTLRQLEHVDTDRGRAIVKLARQASRGTDAEPVVELVDIGGGTGLVLIGSAPILNRIRFLQLAEVGPGRHLIALSPGHGIHELEVALTDLLHDGAARNTDRDLITRLLELLRNFRKSDGVSTAEILLLRLAAASSHPNISQT